MLWRCFKWSVIAGLVYLVGNTMHQMFRPDNRTEEERYKARLESVNKMGIGI